ncbi:MAG: acyltransferase [Clostridia bacterium]|nr:acyltransferase [Clostridia bacterium]
MESRKKNELSAASVFLMLLVIFIHLSAECVNGYLKESAAFALMASLNRLASFAVQGFIFLSGLKLFLKRNEPFSYKTFALSRLRRVILPYLVAFCVFYAVYASLSRISPSVPHFFGELFTAGLATHFYFIAVIVQFYLLMPLWRLLGRRASPLLLCFVSFTLTSVLALHLPELVQLVSGKWIDFNSRLFTSYLFYFVCGMAAGSRYDEFLAFLKRRRIGLGVLWGLSAAADCALFILIRRDFYYPVWADEWHILTSALAILFLISLCAAAGNGRLLRSPLLSRTDGASYLVYLWHPLIILCVDLRLNNLGVVSLTLRFLIRAAVALPLSIALCVGWQALVKRIRKS